MSNKVKFVDYREPVAIKVGKFLLSKGFGVADFLGRALEQLTDMESLGILYKDPEAKQIKFMFGFITREPKPMFPGVIWFDNIPRDANELNWVLDVYGREYVELAMKLAEEMASTFNVNITIRLVREKTRAEFLN